MYLIFRIDDDMLKNLKSRAVVGEIHVEGTVSQNSFLDLSFYFM